VKEEFLKKYFPDLTDDQLEKFGKLKPLYEKWNEQINVISRKDMDNFPVRHVLHSLAIGKIFTFRPGMNILDVGTGGGFPGIPLAILFPEASFSLIDSTAKKIKVVTEVSRELGIKNVTTVWERAEDEKRKYDFVISRAVTEFLSFVKLTQKNVITSTESSEKGIICLKGGDLTEELGKYIDKVKTWDISSFFEDPFFETKKIVFLPF
jgi:16S rRNA (guanine527-N7)-methyltransferase